jgi:hypothetical protein
MTWAEQQQRLEQRRREVGNRPCAGTNAKGQRCGAKASWTLFAASPFCLHHEHRGPAPCVGGGPLDGMWIDRGVEGYNFADDEVAVGLSPDGSTWLMAMPLCNYETSGRTLLGRYRFGYRNTDLSPQWFWEPKKP